MNKKGIVFESLTQIALVLIVLFLIAGVPLYNYTNEKLFDNKGIVQYVQDKWEGKPERPFQPWQGTGLENKDEIVKNSINALNCGIKSIVKGTLSPQDCTEGRFQDNKIYFGDKEVSCESSLSNIEVLAGTNEDELIKRVALLIDNCNKQDLSRVCATLQTTQLGSSSSGAMGENVVITEEKIVKKLNEIQSEATNNLNWELTNVQRGNPSTFYVIKDKELKWHGLGNKNQVKVTSSINSNYQFFVKTGVETPTTCTVKKFELPQEFKGTTKEWARSWITGANDPEYILYHEMFPPEEEKAWQIDKWGFVSDAVIYGGLVNGIFAGVFAAPGAIFKFAKGLRQAGKEAIDEGAQIAIREFGQEVAQQLPLKGRVLLGELFTKEGNERIIKSQILIKELMDAGVSREASQEIGEEALHKISLYKLYGVTDPVAKFLSDDASILINKLAKDLPEEEAKSLQLALRSKLPGMMEDIFRKQLTKDTIREINDLANLKQFINNNLAKEGTEQISREVLEGLIEKVLVNTDESVLKAVGKEAEERLMQRSLDYFNYLSGDINGVSYLTKVLGQKMASSLSQQLDNLASKYVISGKEGLPKLLTGKTTSELTQLLEKAKTKEGLKELVKQSPVQLRWWKLSKVDAATGGATLSIKVPVSVAWSALASLKQTTKLTGQALQTAWEARIIKYALLYQIGQSVARIDAKNEKLSSKGNNNLVLNLPFIFEASKTYNLGDDAKGYPINLKKDTGYTRFFAASPCTSNIKITKQTCSCKLEHKDYVWEEENFRVPIDKTSLSLKKEPSKKYESFKEQTELAQMNQITNCFADDFYGRECKKEMIGNKEIYDEFVSYLYEEFYNPLIDYMQNKPATTATINEFFTQPEQNILIKKESIANEGAFRMLFKNILFNPPAPVQAPEKNTESNYDVVVEDVDLSEIQIDQSAFTGLQDEEVKKNKLSLEEFKVKMQENFITQNLGAELPTKNWGKTINNLLAYEVNKLNNNLKKNAYTFSEDAKKSFLYKSAEKASFQYYIVNEDDIDLTKTAKSCEIADPQETTEMLFGASQNNGRITTPCLLIEHEGIGSTYPEPNYCFSTDHASLKLWSRVVTASSIGLDVTAGVFLTPAGGVAASFVTGALAGMADQLIADKAYWPNH
ncbi:hypothetical protein HY837_05775 [archaeon]|nr:hypothetical protein [archaeon]